jgi:hypothetical protein
MICDFKFRSRYKIESVTDEYFYVIDCDIGRSITNDAENVILELYTLHGLGDRRLFYRDTLGMIDELVHDCGKFLGFKAGHGGFAL